MIKFERVSSDGYQMSLAKGRGGGGRVSLYSEVPCLIFERELFQFCTATDRIFARNVTQLLSADAQPYTYLAIQIKHFNTSLMFVLVYQ